MPEERSRKKFWSSKRIMTAAFIIIGIIIGMLIQHYYIEPVMSEGCGQHLVICKAQMQVLDEENEDCYRQVNDVNRTLTACEYNLARYRETA